ncbi:hypothetical protein [Croceicoccus pelagius]|uniref:Citrate transporter-like domain-containing protein n=1 Tax=Croceicoccus pelagius TaxID=1703341 RepID=A0A917DMY8_9SPHN|nr:hypothetical protein [Croceicoccus pelagius]GGD53103.1 hypothetical protein GCM10010989_29150 [Croceicoccus pelagius]
MTFEVAALIAEFAPYIGLVLLFGIFAAFAIERQPPVVIAVVGGLVMVALGFLPTGELLGVFSNPAPITIAAMFVLTGALLRTGALERSRVGSSAEPCENRGWPWRKSAAVRSWHRPS